MLPHATAPPTSVAQETRTPARSEFPALRTTAPFRAQTSWGVFVLARQIAGRLDVDSPLRFVLSAAGAGAAGTGEMLRAGWDDGVSAVAEGRDAGIESLTVGPHTADRRAQAAELRRLAAAGDVDCIAVQVPPVGEPHSAELAVAIDSAAASGVPVFTVGGDIAGSRRLASFGPSHRAAGDVAGRALARWAVDSRIVLQSAALVAADPADPAAQDRMSGFVEALRWALPRVQIVNEPATALALGDDDDFAYAALRSWILEHPDVDVLLHADAGLLTVAEVLADAALYGDVVAVGFETPHATADYMADGLIAVTVVPDLVSEVAAAARACGAFLLDGVVADDLVPTEPVAITASDVDLAAAQAEGQSP